MVVASKRTKAPAWVVADAIKFLRSEHPTVLQAVANIYHTTKYKTIEEWLNAEASTWGTKLMTLITRMQYNWDIDMLQGVWHGIVCRALKEEGLVDPDGRKLENELMKKRKR
jgi:hypothetical protein